MQRFFFFILVFGIGITGCIQNLITDVKFILESIETHQKGIIYDFGKFVDSTFTDSSDLNLIFNFKTIDQKGNIETVEMNEAINLFDKHISGEKTDLYPIFEIKHSTNVVLPVYGKGLWDAIWSKVVIDRRTLRVVNIDFGHDSETPGLGGNINDSVFRNQFIGTAIDFTERTYALYQSNRKVIEGKQRIDGLSGATLTSRGAIEMLNTKVHKKRVLYINLIKIQPTL